MIFNWYAQFLLSFLDDGIYWDKPLNRARHIYGSIMAYLSKPLGLCVYCNGTWIAIILFFIFSKTFIDISISKYILVFLVIGLNYIFTRIGLLVFNSKQDN